MVCRLFYLVFAFALTVSGALAQSPQEIANRASAAAYYAASDGRADVAMSIVDAKGRKRSRNMTILRRNVAKNNGDQQFYIHFSRPTDVAETSFLVWKKARGNDDRWLYLPALDQVRRIAASDERTSFVGSHFFYEDVSGRAPSDDKHSLQGQDDTFFILRSTPKRGRVEYAYFVSYIEKRTFIPTRVEYYNSSGAMYRLYEAQAVNSINGIPTVTKARMSDVNAGGFTTLTYRNIRYNIGLTDDVFTERSLRTAPQKFIR